MFYLKWFAKFIYVSRVNFEPIISRIKKDTKILELKTDLQMFEAFIEGQVFDSLTKEKLISEARLIIKV